MADSGKGLNRRWPFFRSIRFRIMMLLFVMGIVPALVAETVVVQSYESRALSQREIRVRNQCDILIDQLLKKDYLAHPDDEVINGEHTNGKQSAWSASKTVSLKSSGVNEIQASKDVQSVKYFNMLGVESLEPFNGVNVKVTTFTDGTTEATKIIK